MSTLLYTAKSCGCLVLIMVNDPENLRACRSDISRELRAGRTLHETTKAGLPPVECSLHKGDARASSEAARATRADPLELGL